MKGKKETVGIIDSKNLLKKTRGIQRTCFKTGTYQTEKDRPRNKQWSTWLDDDICWCGDSDTCDNIECFRHFYNKTEAGIFTVSNLKNTELCPLMEEEKDGGIN